MAILATRYAMQWASECQRGQLQTSQMGDKFLLNRVGGPSHLYYFNKHHKDFQVVDNRTKPINLEILLPEGTLTILQAFIALCCSSIQ